MKLTNRSKVVSNKKMSFAEKMYIPAVVKGMGITIRHMFQKGNTLHYPEEQRDFSKIWRGKQVLKRDEEGRERCTACVLWAVVGPAEAMTMTAAERKANERHLYREEKYAEIYEINMLRCIFCGMCEEACPKSAIYLTDNLVDVENNREDFIYGKDKLLESKENPYDITERLKKSYKED